MVAPVKANCGTIPAGLQHLIPLILKMAIRKDSGITVGRWVRFPHCRKSKAYQPLTVAHDVLGHSLFLKTKAEYETTINKTTISSKFTDHDHC